jgi:hypothetical protein
MSRSNLASRDTLTRVQSTVLILNWAVVLEVGGWQQLFNVGTLRNMKVVEVANVTAIAAMSYLLKQAA